MKLFLNHFLQKNYERSFRLSIGWALLWAAVALAVNLNTIINLDNGWLLYAAKRMLAGDRAYVDFYETNPPLILWIFCLPVYVAQLLKLSDVSIFYGFVALLAVVSLKLTLTEIKHHALFANPRFGNIVFAALAQLTLGCSVLLFGQREHLFVLLAMPYFVQASVFEREPRLSARQWLIAVMAGIGLSIKPFFVIIWAAGELYGAIAARNPRLLFRRTNLIIALTGIIYIALVAWLTPAYFETIMPYLYLTYHGFNAPVFALVKASILLCLIYMVPVFLMRVDFPMRAFVGKLFVWFIAAIVTMALQGKGWLNHFYPMMFFGNFLFAGLLALLVKRLSARTITLTLKWFALLWVFGFVLFALPVFHLFNTRETQRFQQEYIEQLSGYVTKYHAEGQPLYALSFDLGAAFPAVDYLPVTFPFHFHHLWALPGIVFAERKGEESERLAQAREFVVRTLVDDLKKYKPPLVVVDSNRELPEALGEYDYIADLSKDAGFAAQWKNYRQAGKIDVQTKAGNWSTGSYTVYVRQ